MSADYVRLPFFVTTFLALAYLENIHPRRERLYPRGGRWIINLGLTFLNGFLVKVLMGSAAVGVAAYAAQNGWGLINALELPWLLGFIVGFLLLDFLVYIQHVVAHALPILWRFHMVHHSDLDFDVTTALRFHPIEILLSMVYKMMLVAAIGVDPWTVVIFEIVLNASPQFNHSNLNIPREWDGRIRRFIVTPDFHRVHHSVEVDETNSNFGFFFSWWDMLCGTYRKEPGKEQTEMTIGVSEYRDSEELTFGRLLLLPFAPRMGGYSMKS